MVLKNVIADDKEYEKFPSMQRNNMSRATRQVDECNPYLIGQKYTIFASF